MSICISQHLSHLVAGDLDGREVLLTPDVRLHNSPLLKTVRNPPQDRKGGPPGGDEWSSQQRT